LDLVDNTRAITREVDNNRRRVDLMHKELRASGTRLGAFDDEACGILRGLEVTVRRVVETQHAQTASLNALNGKIDALFATLGTMQQQSTSQMQPGSAQMQYYHVPYTNGNTYRA
jgi:hypothetical protein